LIILIVFMWLDGTKAGILQQSERVGFDVKLSLCRWNKWKQLNKYKRSRSNKENSLYRQENRVWPNHELSLPWRAPYRKSSCVCVDSIKI
jgi:hypothetical protein